MRPAQVARSKEQRFKGYFSVTTTPNTMYFACGIGSCTLQCCCEEYIKGNTSQLHSYNFNYDACAGRTTTRRFNGYFSVTTTPNTRCFACGLGSCTLLTRTIPRERKKNAWGEQESSDTSRLAWLRHTLPRTAHETTRDSTATFPLLQVEHEATNPVFCTLTRLM